jgi:hypothetical protein
MAKRWQGRSDDVLAALRAIPPLADKDDACWHEDTYRMNVAYPYLALAQVPADRRLRPAIGLLLERPGYGDPGETMRGLRQTFEAIVDPDWNALTEICLAAARSTRGGTRRWAIDQLLFLDDMRAKPIFEEALHDDSPDIRETARIGLERLGESE